MAEVTSPAIGGILARRLLPAAILLPVICGWIRWQGELHHLYSAATGLALYSTSNVVVFAILVWLNTKRLNRSDAERTRAEAAIKVLNEDLEARVRSRTRELVRASEQLAFARAGVQNILDAATQVAIIATDREGVIRVFNSGAEQMLGYRMDEVVGVHTPVLFHTSQELIERRKELSAITDHPLSGFDALVAAALGGAWEERESTLVRKDGSEFDASLAITAVRNSEGAIDGFLKVATDITTRKSLERQLRANNQQLAEQTRAAEEANHAKSQFLASMSHEIRTPMNSILGMADLLWDSGLNPEQRQYVEVFRRAGRAC